jgi:hypothetical protein
MFTATETPTDDSSNDNAGAVAGGAVLSLAMAGTASAAVVYAMKQVKNQVGGGVP